MALRYHALAVGWIFSSILFGISTSGGAVDDQPEKVSKKEESAKMKVIEIVPSKSIGAVALGAPVKSLPKDASVAELDGR